MITGNEPYFPIPGSMPRVTLDSGQVVTPIGVTIKEKFMMDWANTHIMNYGYNHYLCLKEAAIAFSEYLKFMNHAG